MQDTKILKYNNALILAQVKKSFVDLAVAVNKDLGFDITVVESYKYEWDVLDELKGKIKSLEIKKSLTDLSYTTASLSANIVSDKSNLHDLLNQQNPTESISNYQRILHYVNALPPTEFEPPLGPNVFSLRNPSTELVYSIPNYPEVDPRRTGRIIRIGPRQLINPTLLKYLVNNAGKYGFIHYGPQDPAVWYWRGDKFPITDSDGTERFYYTSQECVGTFTSELSYLL